MKILVRFFYLLLFLFLSCSNNSNAIRKDWVFDQENILTTDEEKVLNNIIVNFEKETTNEIAIVTTDNIGEHQKMVFYAVDFGNKYGIGKVEKDNGLIIVLSKTLRETFISTGLSTENILKDEICKRIVDEKMVPEFKEDRYFKGLKQCIRIWKEN